MKVFITHHCDVNPYRIKSYNYQTGVPLPAPGDTIVDDDDVCWYVRDVSIHYKSHHVEATIYVSDEP